MPTVTPASPGPKPRPKPVETPIAKDVFREVVETVVFVIVLVFLLKIFVAEAFVIPTGSMAETLLGYQKFVTCAQCGHVFPVNCSQEVDPQDGRTKTDVDAASCPNCRYREVWRDPVGAQGSQKKLVKEPPGWGSGDRVLVAKFPYDESHLQRLGKPERFNVVVFKYPEEPQRAFIPMNYIKRLIGLPCDTIAIYNGDLYVLSGLNYPEDAKHPRPGRTEDLWRKRPIDYTYEDYPAAIDAFNRGEFAILRRPPEVMMVMRRLVYDNDHQAADLLAHRAPPRWLPTGGWEPTDPASPKAFRHVGAGGEDGWLRYRHIIMERSNLHPLDRPVDPPQPQVIKNFMGYNAGEPSSGRIETSWVGDLMLECTAQVDAPQGELILELSEGSERFQARFDLTTGDCTLARVGYETEGKNPIGKPVTLASREKVLTGPGSHDLRFANFDDRLTLWVDGKLAFGDGVNYEPNYIGQSRKPATAQEDHPNNLEPAGVGVRGGAKVAVSHLQLWRDTFYTNYPDFPLDQTKVRTLYVQPGHYLCLGDNSTESADSRSWGLVPERLMLGRAQVVYWPPTRAGVIR